jgi:glycosyltransferase involved in cell wall biosynthesis
MKVAVYGPKVGYDSFEVVTRGYLEGASDWDRLAGWASVGREHQPEDGMDWVGSGLGIMCGPYTSTPRMAAGSHRRLAVVVAPNSTWIPDSFYSLMRAYKVSMVVVPSEWGKSVLQDRAPKWFDAMVSVVPHGVLKGHHLAVEDEEQTFGWDRKDDRFLIAHFCNSSAERKGTSELMKAFARWDRRKESKLCIVANPADWPRLEAIARGDLGMDNIVIATRVNAPPEIMRWLYRTADVVCQPSRAEGFGLVPLEALANGTPVAMTTATGHAQYAFDDDGKTLPGIVDIPVGPVRRVSYDPGGEAPSVDVDEIVCALSTAYNFHGGLKELAVVGSARILAKHSWKAATEGLFGTLKEET